MLSAFANSSSVSGIHASPAARIAAVVCISTNIGKQPRLLTIK